MAKRTSKSPPGPGWKLIFRRWITKNGERIYPKTAKFFAFWVKA